MVQGQQSTMGEVRGQTSKVWLDLLTGKISGICVWNAWSNGGFPVLHFVRWPFVWFLTWPTQVVAETALPSASNLNYSISLRLWCSSMTRQLKLISRDSKRSDHRDPRIFANTLIEHQWCCLRYCSPFSCIFLTRQSSTVNHSIARDTPELDLRRTFGELDFLLFFVLADPLLLADEGTRGGFNLANSSVGDKSATKHSSFLRESINFAASIYQLAWTASGREFRSWNHLFRKDFWVGGYRCCPSWNRCSENIWMTFSKVYKPMSN